MDKSEFHEKRPGGRPALCNSKEAQADANRSTCRPQQLPAWLFNLVVNSRRPFLYFLELTDDLRAFLALSKPILSPGHTSGPFFHSSHYPPTQPLYPL
jgi:hypothetical protein